MQDQNHYRHEYKYEITYVDYYELRARLGCLMQRDSHVDADGRYRVHSLYFDNCNDTALREKIDGVAKREKFRIRYYGDAPTHLSLEKKQKVNGLCLKVAAPIGRDACEALIRGDPLMLDGDAPPADFFSPTPLSALRRDHMILEVKYDAFLPSVIADALQLGEIRVSAFSKYAACREYE